MALTEDLVRCMRFTTCEEGRGGTTSSGHGRLRLGAERALGPVTIAVANAGIYPNCTVLDMTVEKWDRMMETENGFWAVPVHRFP